jgi:hypothetical protein
MSHTTKEVELCARAPVAFDGNIRKASRWLHSIKAYFTVNTAVYSTDEKKVVTALEPAGPSTRQSANNMSNHEISDSQLEHILDVMGSAWAQSTKEMYGAGLLVFHIFCDTNSIKESKHCPISHTLLLNFLCSCAGMYSGSALANYSAGLRAWHLLHGRDWLIPPRELKEVPDRAATSAPAETKKPKCHPYTPAFLATIHNHLNLNNHWMWLSLHV